MTSIDYIIAFLALTIFYFLGMFITQRVSPSNYRPFFVKYYIFSFSLSVISIIVVHLGFVFDGILDGIPTVSDFDNDSIIYILSAKAIIKEGIFTTTLDYYNSKGAYTYVILIAILFTVFGTNNLVVIFFNAFLYGIAVVLFGKYASFYFNKDDVKKSMTFFILFFTFLSYTVVPLKEILIFVLLLLVLVYIEKIKKHFNVTSLLLLLLFLLMLSFTRVYVAIIIFSATIIYYLSEFRYRNISITIVYISLGIFLFMNANIGGIGFNNFFFNTSFNIGVWKQDGNITIKGADNALAVVLSGDLNYFSIFYHQIVNYLFQPLFTSYPRIEEFLSTGTYLKAIIYYLGSFTWFALIPSAVYGFFYIIRKRKNLIMLYLPPLLFFIFFLFIANQMRYQLIIKLFFILSAVYGLHFYHIWKKYLFIWIILYLLIAFLTL